MAVFSVLAIGFASFSTILPLFVASMTNSATLIGLVPAIHATGWLLPQLFTASHTSRLRRYKRTVVITTIHERLPFLGLAIVALLLPKIGLQAGLISHSFSSSGRGWEVALLQIHGQA